MAGLSLALADVINQTKPQMAGGLNIPLNRPRVGGSSALISFNTERNISSSGRTHPGQYCGVRIRSGFVGRVRQFVLRWSRDNGPSQKPAAESRNLLMY